jgi:hypothetical protein
MSAGLAGPQDHIDAIRYFKESLPELTNEFATRV